MSKKFSFLIQLKFHVSYSYAMRISNFKFHENRRKIFFDLEGSPLWIFQIIFKCFSEPRGGLGNFFTLNILSSWV